MVELVKRLDKGAPLTYEEMDRNLISIDRELENKVNITTSSMAIVNAIVNLRDGVDSAGDTLLKLYNLIIGLENSKISFTDIVNNVNQYDTNKPLSAYQGKLLRDALNKEISDRVAAGNSDLSVITTTINNEVNNRKAADNVLQSKIDSILSNTDATTLNSLSEIVAAFSAADSNLIAALNLLSANSNTALNTETSNRINAINLEVSNRNAAITAEANLRNIAITEAISELESRLYSI